MPQLKIVYEDADLLVVNKPAGLLTTPGRFDKRCLASAVINYRQTAQIVHRLDLDTSGLVVLGCSQPSIAGLNRLFRERRITKSYEALVAGQAESGNQQITFPLGPNRLHRPKQKIVWRGGKPALTLYRAKRFSAGVTRLKVTPVTGVRHQLRLHLALVGLPILGCDLYAPSAVASAADRLMLHASGLAFDHPVSGEPLNLNAPPDF